MESIFINFSYSAGIFIIWCACWNNQQLIWVSRPKLTWDESVKRDLKDWNISKEIALDRSAWRLAINVPEPWTFFFRVSSLDYPNLLGKKSYVVVCCCWFCHKIMRLLYSFALRQCSPLLNYKCSDNIMGTREDHLLWQQRQRHKIIHPSPCNTASTWIFAILQASSCRLIIHLGKKNREWGWWRTHNDTDIAIAETK